MTKDAKSKVKIEKNIVKGEEVPLGTNYTHLGKYVLDSISVSPDAVAQIDTETGESDTFANIKDRSIRCALWLRKHGVRPNDVIGISTHNQLNTCIPLYAALYLGAPYIAIHSNSDIKNAKYFLSLGKPKVIFVSDESVKVMLQAVKELELDAIIVIFGKYPGIQSFADILVEASEQDVTNFTCNEIPNAQHIAMISPTSGTTGMPKGAALPHEYFMRLFQSFNNSQLIDGPILTFTKLPWITSSWLIMNSAIARLSRIIFTQNRNFTTEALFDVINKYKPSYLQMSISMMQEVVKSENAHKCDFSSLKSIVVGGSYVSSESITVLKELAKNATVTQLYGMTEVGTISLLQSDVKANCVGLPFENFQIKIVDIQSGAILGSNQKGEICLYTPAKMIGYYKNPEATEAAFDAEGFLCTGDVGYYDDHGYLFFIDRLKELIKFKGVHIAPTEIEAILQSHPAVQEAALVSKLHEMDAEHPVAFVTKVPGQEVTEQELIDLVEKEVMYEKRLRGGVIFLDSMPHTASDKINKPKLREMLNRIA